MRTERMEIMRVNGHNDQCTCVECASPNQVQIAAFVGPSAGIQLNDIEQTIIDRRFDHSEQLFTSEAVQARALVDCPLAVVGGRIVGAISLEHAGPTGLIVAIEVQVSEQFSEMPPRWAVWWDRTINALVARPLRGQTT